MADPRRAKFAEPRPLLSRVRPDVAERFGSGGSKVGAVEFRDCLPGRRGHADELAIPMCLRRHVAAAPRPASLLDEPVPAVEHCSLLQQPVADLGVQRRLDPSIGLRFPTVDAVHRERNRRGPTLLLASPAMRRTKALRIAS